MEVFVSEKDNVLTEYDGVITTLVVTESVEIKSLDQHDAEIRADERNYIIDEMPKVLADSIIEITENLDKLEFYDLEKIARKFEQKLAELEKTPQGKGEKELKGEK